jgi:hypothetical protein
VRVPVVLAMVTALGLGAGRSSTSACRAEDGYSDNRVQYLNRIMQAHDSLSVKIRTRLQLPVSSAGVGIARPTTSPESTCGAARAAYIAAIASDTIQTPTVYVITVQNGLHPRYVVSDGLAHGGEFNYDAVFNESFRLLAGAAD